MIVNGEAVCDQCGGPSPDQKVDDEHRCEVCRGKIRGYDEGYREALRAQFDQVADLIEQDGGLDLIDLVCERVQAGERRMVELDELRSIEPRPELDDEAEAA